LSDLPLGLCCGKSTPRFFAVSTKSPSTSQKLIPQIKYVYSHELQKLVPQNLGESSRSQRFLSFLLFIRFLHFTGRNVRILAFSRN